MRNRNHVNSFGLTVDNDRLVKKLIGMGKLPPHVNHLNGFNLFQTVDEDGIPAVSVVLGPINSGRRGRRPQAIPLSVDINNRPYPNGDRLMDGDVSEYGDEFKLVRKYKDDVALRTIRTGLLSDMRGGVMEDMMNLSAERKAMRYHGAFPLVADSGLVVGEGIDLDITNQSRIVTDERFGKIHGAVGIPKFREVMIEGVIGGPVIVGQIDGTLKIHELTKRGWNVHDVTDSADWQKTFMDLANADTQYLAAIEADAKRKGKKDRQIKVVKVPTDHPDAA
jgi:hypothetical protein